MTQIPTPGAGSAIPPSSVSPTSDHDMSSEDDSSDSEAVRRTLHYSSPQTTTPSDPSADIPPNVPIGTFTHETPGHDSSMQTLSHVEAPPSTTSVASQPNTVNQQASAPLQRLHNYIDEAVEQAVGARYNQLADTINNEIVSIKNQVLQPTQDEDDPMSPDQPNDNPADGDDEAEEESRDHQRNLRNRQQAAGTKDKRNRRNRQQKSDDSEDESDSEANNNRRRKAPIVLKVHFFLTSHINLLTQT